MPAVIPPEGDVQVFADSACTQYATGVITDVVYVRLNRNFGYNESVSINSTGVQTPCRTDPDNDYLIFANLDWVSESYQDPFTEGSVIECRSIEPMEYDGAIVISIPAPESIQLTISPALPHLQTNSVERYTVSFPHGFNLEEWRVNRAVIKIDGYEMIYDDSHFNEPTELADYIMAGISIYSLESNSFVFDVDLVDDPYEIKSFEIIA